MQVAAAVDVAPWSAAEVVAQGLLTASRYRSQACSHITPDSPPRQYLNTAATAEQCYKRMLTCDAHSSQSALGAAIAKWKHSTMIGIQKHA